MSKTDATLGNGLNLLVLANNKKLDKEAFDALDQTGLLADLFEAANTGQLKVVDREAFRRLVKLPPLNSSLIDWLGTVTTSATNQKFVVNDNFKLKKDGGICSYLGDNFKEWFDGKVEDLIGAQTLRYGKLNRSANDVPLKEGEQAIIPELGGEAKAETTLTEVYDLMARQAKGQKGVLLTNGWANIFYVRDKNGVLRAVIVDWIGGGWSVGAFSIGSPFRWLDGSRVFSRN